MARDYSNRGGNSRSKARTGTNGKRKTAPAKKRRSAPKKNARKATGTPKWVWVGCLLFLGIAVGAVSYIVTRPTDQPGRDFASVEVPRPQESAATTQKAAAEAQRQKPEQAQFAFYEMLPDYEVVIPGEMEEIKRRGRNGGNDSSASQDAESADTAASESEHYIIQVGAFTNTTDANQLRAKVTLLGLQAKVVRSQSDSGQAIYRVRSNVINSGERLQEMLKRLHDQNIETLVLRRTE